MFALLLLIVSSASNGIGSDDVHVLKSGHVIRMIDHDMIILSTIIVTTKISPILRLDGLQDLWCKFGMKQHLKFPPPPPPPTHTHTHKSCQKSEVILTRIELNIHLTGLSPLCGIERGLSAASSPFSLS